MTNMATYFDFIFPTVSSQCQFDSIYSDLSHAFDCVLHPTLPKNFVQVGSPVVTSNGFTATLPLRIHLSAFQTTLKFFGMPHNDLS